MEEGSRNAKVYVDSLLDNSKSCIQLPVLQNQQTKITPTKIIFLLVSLKVILLLVESNVYTIRNIFNLFY